MNYKRLFIQNCLIFITIVTNERQPILISNISTLKKSVLEVKNFYKFEILAYCILKDHIHFILKPDNVIEYPKIIKSFKYSFTKKYKFNNVGLVKPTYKIWQNRYWEHTIKNENDLNKHIDYIHYNSFKHYNISPKNWKYSSFLKFVKNNFYNIDWCNYEDKNNINELNFE